MLINVKYIKFLIFIHVRIHSMKLLLSIITCYEISIKKEKKCADII